MNRNSFHNYFSFFRWFNKRQQRNFVLSWKSQSFQCKTHTHTHTHTLTFCCRRFSIASIIDWSCLMCRIPWRLHFCNTFAFAKFNIFDVKSTHLSSYIHNCVFCTNTNRTILRLLIYCQKTWTLSVVRFASIAHKWWRHYSNQNTCLRLWLILGFLTTFCC